MKKETLQCSTCQKNWKRIPTRGRKPHQCPKCTSKIVPKQSKSIVQVQQIKTRKVTAKPIAQVQASAQNSDSKNDISVGEVFQYYHPTDEKLKESTKGGSQWKCKHCGYTLTVKLSLTAVPTHKCTENGRSHPMERI